MRNNKFTVKTRVSLDSNQLKEARAFLNFGWLKTEILPTTKIELPKQFLEASANLNRFSQEEFEIDFELDKYGKMKILGIKSCS